MFTVIFGRPGCPYCVRAKELAEKLSKERDDFNYRYIDIHAEGITKADVAVHKKRERDPKKMRHHVVSHFT